MRALIALALLASCVPAAPPQVELARNIGPETVKPPEMICSVTGEEALVYTLTTGEETAPLPTGRRCDYEAWRAYVDAYGQRPLGEWRMQTHEEWLRARGDSEA